MARVDGGPESLLRLDERRRLSGQPPLGPMLLTPDALRAGLPAPVVTVTDTPLARETDYGRVDDHSSAIRAAGDPRNTFNRVPDYPAGDTDPVYGQWSGGRSRCRVRRRIPPRCPTSHPPPAPPAAIDGDSSTSWVSNALQTAIGQWLQVDFDHPVTNATLTITPSATAVGAQVRRLEVSTVNGTTTVRFDEAGKPVTVALPYGESPWVRITAVGTDDGSPGVQFGITDFTVTQYDANGFAHPVDLRHTVEVPGPPPGSAVAQWDLGIRTAGPPRLRREPHRDPVRGGDGAGLRGTGEPEPDPDGARADRGDADGVGARPPGPEPRRPDRATRNRHGPQGDADPIDVLGSAYAATDGDPGTAWTAPQRVVQPRTPPTLVLKLPAPQKVAALRVTPSSSALPAHPTMIAVDLGDGPEVRRLTEGTETLELKPRVTDTITVSLLDWDDVIDRTALGFDQLKPPGLAEIVALDARGAPIAAADADVNRARTVSMPCGQGPIIGVAGQFVQTSVTTTVGALLDNAADPGTPVPRRADHAARRAAGVADQPRAGVHRRRRPARGALAA